MISENTPAADIIAQTKRDAPHVLHALKKSYGGAQRYKQAIIQLSDRVLREAEGTTIIDNIEQYHSPRTGIDYVIFAYSTNVGFCSSKQGYQYFAWWNTPDGSIATVRMADHIGLGATMVLIYTGHFFKRYAEREGLGEVDLQLVIQFMIGTSDGIFNHDIKPGKPGVYRCDIIFDGGIGRGYTTGMDPTRACTFTALVSTYLPDRMLNAKQRRDTAKSREIQASKRRIADTFVSLLIEGDNDALIERIEEIFCCRGQCNGFGTSFCELMAALVLYDCDMRNVPQANLRQAMLAAFHRYKQTVFNMVTICPRTRYNIEQIVRCAKYADPEGIDIEHMLTHMFRDSDQHLSPEAIHRIAEQMNQTYNTIIARRKHHH